MRSIFLIFVAFSTLLMLFIFALYCNFLVENIILEIIYFSFLFILRFRDFWFYDLNANFLLHLLNLLFCVWNLSLCFQNFIYLPR